MQVSYKKTPVELSGGGGYRIRRKRTYSVVPAFDYTGRSDCPNDKKRHHKCKDETLLRRAICWNYARAAKARPVRRELYEAGVISERWPFPLPEVLFFPGDLGVRRLPVAL